MASQSTYGSWKGYDLLYVPSLHEFLLNELHWVVKPSSGSSVEAAYVIMGDAGDGPWSHTCIGVSSGTVDCHNMARYHVSASGEFYQGVDAVLAPP
jgi:hypothetical protein